MVHRASEQFEAQALGLANPGNEKLLPKEWKLWLLPIRVSEALQLTRRMRRLAIVGCLGKGSIGESLVMLASFVVVVGSGQEVVVVSSSSRLVLRREGRTSSMTSSTLSSTLAARRITPRRRLVVMEWSHEDEDEPTRRAREAHALGARVRVQGEHQGLEDGLKQGEEEGFHDAFVTHAKQCMAIGRALGACRVMEEHLAAREQESPLRQARSRLEVLFLRDNCEPTADVMLALDSLVAVMREPGGAIG
jgi:hypothetical protein